MCSTGCKAAGCGTVFGGCSRAVFRRCVCLLNCLFCIVCMFLYVCLELLFCANRNSGLASYKHILSPLSLQTCLCHIYTSTWSMTTSLQYAYTKRWVCVCLISTCVCVCVWECRMQRERGWLVTPICTHTCVCVFHLTSNPLLPICCCNGCSVVTVHDCATSFAILTLPGEHSTLGKPRLTKFIVCACVCVCCVCVRACVYVACVCLRVRSLLFVLD